MRPDVAEAMRRAEEECNRRTAEGPKVVPLEPALDELADDEATQFVDATHGRYLSDLILLSEEAREQWLREAAEAGLQSARAGDDFVQVLREWYVLPDAVFDDEAVARRFRTRFVNQVRRLAQLWFRDTVNELQDLERKLAKA